MSKDTQFSDLLGRTLVSVDRIGDEELIFTAVTGEQWRMRHYQDCCESVTIESIVGDLADLIGSPILKAEEAISDEAQEGAGETEGSDDSFTWTFYKLATIKGYVDIRWFGSSNGYYSERVHFVKIKP